MTCVFLCGYIIAEYIRQKKNTNTVEREPKASTNEASDWCGNNATILHPEGNGNNATILHPEGNGNNATILHPEGNGNNATILHPEGNGNNATILHPEGKWGGGGGSYFLLGKNTSASPTSP